MNFKPNELKLEEIDSLEDWRLLVAACHFGPTMSDCVYLDYAYRYDEANAELFLATTGDRDISLKGDFDLDNPEESLSRHAGIDVDWRVLARQRLKETIKAKEGGAE